MFISLKIQKIQWSRGILRYAVTFVLGSAGPENRLNFKPTLFAINLFQIEKVVCKLRQLKTKFILGSGRRKVPVRVTALNNHLK